MTLPSLKFLEQYWLGEVGCAPADLHSGKTVVVRHGTMEVYNGVLGFQIFAETIAVRLRVKENHTNDQKGGTHPK